MDSDSLGLSTLQPNLIKFGATSINAVTLPSAVAYVIVVWWLAIVIERSVMHLATRRNGGFGSNARVHMISRLLSGTVQQGDEL